MQQTLFYREEGSGVPLVLLHGNGEDGTYFSHQIPYFSKTYRVLAVDTRGHGRSPRGTAPFTIAQFARDLHEWIADLKLDAPVLLGFSDGANIAMRFAVQYPGQTRALILNGGNLDPSGVKRRVQIPIEIGYRLAKWGENRSEKAKAHREMLGLMVNDPNLTEAELSRITAPTLVIAGTNDMIRTAHTGRIAAAIPNAQLQWIKGDHFIAARNPQAFNRAVEEFLSRRLQP